MKPMLFSLLAPAVLAAAFTPGASAQGKLTEHTFTRAPVNSMGIKSLAELRGKPVVIDFWGKN